MEEHLFIFKINVQQQILYTPVTAAMMDSLTTIPRYNHGYIDITTNTWQH